MADRFVSSLADGTGDGTSEASPWTLLQAQDLANGDDVWIKADGEYKLVTLGVNTFTPVNGQNRYRGYSVSPGDLAHPGVVFDLEQHAGPMAKLEQVDTVLENVLIKNGAQTGPRHGVFVTADFCLVRRVRVDGISKNGFRVDGAGTLVDECEAVNFSLSGGGSGFLLGAVNAACRNCFAHDGAGSGFSVSAGAIPVNGFDGCIAANNVEEGFSIGPVPGYSVVLRHCVSVGNAVGVSVEEIFGNDVDLVRCIIGANATGIAGHPAGLSRVRSFGLARWGNTVEVSGNVDIRALGDTVDLAADPFVNSGGPQYDFRLRTDQRELLGTARSGFVMDGLAAAWTSFTDYGAVLSPSSPLVNPMLGY